MNYKKCGYITIFGRNNVGKSTLFNNIIGKKISITSNKIQTTQNFIAGVKYFNNSQMIFFDSPGLLLKTQEHNLKSFNFKFLKSIIYSSDLILFIVDFSKYNIDDVFIFNLIERSLCPIFLIINKIDKIKNKSSLTSLMKNFYKKKIFSEIIPISAKKNLQINFLLNKLLFYLPKKSFLFKEKHSFFNFDKFMISEIVREKIIRILYKEIPYFTIVKVLNIISNNICIYIDVVIYVKKNSQKYILIGSGGNLIKKIGILSRIDMELLFKKKIFLNIWVKLSNKFSDNLDEFCKFIF